MSDDVVLTVNGKEFSGWEGVSIERSMGTCADAFSLAGPFNPDRKEVADAFRPFGYQLVTLKIDDQLILTGRNEMPDLLSTPTDRTINVQGRSLTGPLVECQIDGQGYNFQGMSLLSIAKKLCQPFGIEVVSTAGIGPVKAAASSAATIAAANKTLDDSRADPGQSIFDYLQGIAKPAGLLLTSDEKGRLLIIKPDAMAAPVAALVEGAGHILSFGGSYNGTGRWSKYRVMMQADGTPGIKGDATDKGVGIYRPRVITGSDGDAKNITKAAEMQRALAYAAAVQIPVTVTGWRNTAGSVWTPGQIVTGYAPGIYINRETRFMIDHLNLSLDAENGRITTLALVLPATYTGQLPEVEPWA